MEPLGPEAKAFVDSPVGQGLMSDDSLWFRLVSLDGHYLFVSPQVTKFLGYEPEAFKTLKPQEVFHEDELHLSATVMASLHKGPINATYRMRHKDGHFVWVNSFVQQMGDMMIILGRDVPERLGGASWKHVEPFL